eukprot:1763117-Pleurochrysis_carterae.AAC.2
MPVTHACTLGAHLLGLNSAGNPDQSGCLSHGRPPCALTNPNAAMQHNLARSVRLCPVAQQPMWILSFIPLTPIELALGYLLGVGPAYLVVFTGKVAGCLAAFLLGRTVARDWAQRTFGRHELLQALDLAVSERPFQICVIVRFLRLNAKSPDTRTHAHLWVLETNPLRQEAASSNCKKIEHGSI